jgi:hypothetical protein
MRWDKEKQEMGERIQVGWGGVGGAEDINIRLDKRQIDEMTDNLWEQRVYMWGLTKKKKEMEQRTVVMEDIQRTHRRLEYA